jgi:hypothetical protein
MPVSQMPASKLCRQQNAFLQNAWRPNVYRPYLPLKSHIPQKEIANQCLKLFTSVIYEWL